MKMYVNGSYRMSPNARVKEALAKQCCCKCTDKEKAQIVDSFKASEMKKAGWSGSADSLTRHWDLAVNAGQDPTASGWDTY